MHLSCKISNSVLTYFEQEGIDYSDLLDQVDMPEEFLRDPSCWMPDHAMESFLEAVMQRYGSIPLGTSEHENLLQKIGHSVSQLRSLGALDSVLRMMPKPQDTFAQPQRFLSYFISPEVTVQNFARTDHSIVFDLGVSVENFSLVKTFLAANFEALPTFVGRSLANCKWQKSHFELDWQADQTSMLSLDEGDRRLSPELLQSVVASLEKNQRELEEKHRELQLKNEELLLVQQELRSALLQKSQVHKQQNLDIFDQPAATMAVEDQVIQSQNNFIVSQNIAKLQDYMTRAQQLITMLIAQDRLNPGVRAAIKKVGWEAVCEQFPRLAKESQELLHLAAKNEIKNQIHKDN